MHQSFRKKITHMLLVVGLVIGIGLVSFNNNIYAAKNKSITTGTYGGLSYEIKVKDNIELPSNIDDLKYGDLELIFNGEQDFLILSALNRKYSEEEQNQLSDTYHFTNGYPTFPFIYFLNHRVLGIGLTNYIDTVKFNTNGNKKIKLPKNISYMFYKCPNIKSWEGLQNLDISNTENMESLFDANVGQNLDISTWNIKNKYVGDLGINLLDPENKTIKVGPNTIFEMPQTSWSSSSYDGKMINQETGFTYNADTFFKDYDGTHPGTYKYVPNN